MATYQFKNALASSVGKTETVVYTTPSSKKSIAIGCSVTNLSKAALPITLRLVKQDLSSVNLATAARINGGQSFDFLGGRKLVLLPGDQIRLTSSANNSLDCVVSVLEDVE